MPIQDENTASWAVIAPVPTETLRVEAIRQFRLEFPGDDTPWPMSWLLRSEAENVSILIEQAPGSEDTIEQPLAESLSAKTKKPVFVVYFDYRVGPNDYILVIDDTRQRYFNGTIDDLIAYLSTERYPKDGGES